MSGAFYRRIVDRTFVDAFPHHRIGYALGAGALAAALVAAYRSPRLLAPRAASACALVAGWLVFPAHYFLHDYYQLPANLFLLIAIAILAGWTESKLSPTSRGMIVAAMVIAAPALMIFGTSKRDLRIASMSDAMAFVVASKETFLYVIAPAYGAEVTDPSMGGFLKKKFSTVTNDEFERMCEKYADRYDAILIRGATSCAAHLSSRFSRELVSRPHHLFYDRR